MDAHRQRGRVGLLAGIVATLLVLILAAVVVGSTGAYNVAASAGHTAGMRWFLDTTMHSSVEARAAGGDPAAWLAVADVTAGAHEYKAMCQHCHGGPGADPHGWSRGMLPRPPHLTEAASEWTPAEVFWIVQHGIKYTGMPAFGETHDEATIRNIAAFVHRLPGMTPEQYAAYGGEAAGDAHGHGGHDHGGQRNGERVESVPQHGGASDAHDHDHDHADGAP